VRRNIRNLALGTQGLSSVIRKISEVPMGFGGLRRRRSIMGRPRIVWAQAWHHFAAVEEARRILRQCLTMGMCCYADRLCHAALFYTETASQFDLVCKCLRPDQPSGTLCDSVSAANLARTPNTDYDGASDIVVFPC
jgi:hypothetical protein